MALLGASAPSVEAPLFCRMSCLGQHEDQTPVSQMGCHWCGGLRMYQSVSLVGQVILIVEDEKGPFAQQLQSALERVGAETMLAPTPARARDHASRFDFSVAAIYADGVIRSVEFRRLLRELGSMPVLLYGAEPPPYGWFRDARFLVTSNPSHTGAIVEAVTRLLSSSVPSRTRPSTLNYP